MYGKQTNSKHKLKFLFQHTQYKSFFKRTMMPKNYYEQLGVPIDSDYETIKKSYYDLAKKFHPDLNPSKDAHVNLITYITAFVL